VVRLFAFVCSLVLSGCTQPTLIGFRASLKNTCDYSVQITVPRYTNADNGRYQSLNTGEAADVLNLMCPTGSGIFNPHVFDSTIKKLEKCLPHDYLLKMSANGNQRSLDRSQLLEILKRTKPDEPYFDIWTIADPSLCP
jgi:hypothetical protein